MSVLSSGAAAGPAFMAPLATGSPRSPLAATAAVGEDPRLGGRNAATTVAAAAAAVTCLAVTGVSSRRSRATRRGTTLARQVLGPRRGCMEPFDASKSAVGITAPLGFWDPLGLMKERVGDELQWQSEDTFYTFQQAEIKHGRICMLAALGILVSSKAQLPGLEGTPSGIATLSTPASAGLGIIAIVAGWLELVYNDEGREPGNLGDPLNTLWREDEYVNYSVDMRNREINHGRLAMSAVASTILFEYGTGTMPTFQLGSFSGGLIVAGIAALLVLQQTPTFTYEEIRQMEAKMKESRGAITKITP